MQFMNWIIWEIVLKKRRKLEQSEPGRRISDLQRQGHLMIENASLCSVLATFFLMFLIFCLILLVNNVANEEVINPGAAIMSILSIFLFNWLFYKKVAKSKKFRKIDNELKQLLNENSQENEIFNTMREISKL